MRDAGPQVMTQVSLKVGYRSKNPTLLKCKLLIVLFLFYVEQEDEDKMMKNSFDKVILFGP